MSPYPHARSVPLFALALLAIVLSPLSAQTPAPPQPTPEVQALLDKGKQAAKAYQWEEALRFFNAALEKARTLKDRSDEASTLISIGVVYWSTGQPEKALDYYQQALPLCRAIGDRRGEAGTLGNIGIVYYATGQPQKALEFYQQALPLCHAIGDRRGEADALNDLGLVNYATGQPQKALDYYQQALPLERTVGDRKGEANALTNIGIVYASTGQPEKALDYFQLALPIFQAVGDRRGEANTLNNIGTVYQNTGQPQKALECFQQALTIHRQTGSRQFEANTLTDIGDVCSSTDQPQKALEYFQQALTIYRAVGDKNGEADNLCHTARADRSLHRIAAAQAHLAQAVSLLEQLRESLGGLSEAKQAFLASRLEAYHAYLSLLLERHQTIEAFNLAQKTKARALLDVMASGKVQLNASLTPQEQQQERQLRSNADQLSAQMIKEGVQNEPGSKQRFAALKLQLQQAESALATFEDSLYARHPDLARKRAARTATLADVARFLPEDTALLEYVVLHAGTGKDALDQTVLFVVTSWQAQPEVHACRLELSSTALSAQTEAFRQVCADPRKPYQSRAQTLYRLLIEPVQKQLAGKKRLLVCPDGLLWDVPFSALMQHRTFLAQRYELDYAYSATGALTALSVRRGHPRGSVLALANPAISEAKRFGDNPALPGQRPLSEPSRPISEPSRPLSEPSRDLRLQRGAHLASLQGTRQEADWLHNHYPDAAIYTGAQAQESLVKAQAGRYRYVHLASHAFFNDAAPLLSSVLLADPPAGSSEDGFLTAREIFDLNLSAELVVLSACNTARGEKRSGEGIVGLTWALFAAGCPTQVLSQWSVDDASTAALMEGFYAGLKRGQAKGAALRSSELALLKDGAHRHPYYWAPFVLVGDWRR
jgi:CHAT domain-containing protein/Tfp pilus assembly protein PilF